MDYYDKMFELVNVGAGKWMYFFHYEKESKCFDRRWKSAASAIGF